jgi:hypothetical protein
MTPLLYRTFLLACLVAVAPACASEDEDQELEPLAQTTQAVTNVGPSLANGVRTTIASVTGAENQVFTSTGRLFVTGDKGIYELRKQADDTFELIVRASEQKSPFCQFGGITEARGALYANCYGITDSYLFAAILSDEPTFASIAKLSGNGFANGMTSDAAGRVYVATTFQDQILRFTLSQSDPLVVAKREVWQKGSGAFTNGLAYFADNLYWSDVGAIKRNTSDKQLNRPQTVINELTFFDDLLVDESGFLITDFIGNVLRAYGNDKRPTGQTKKLFDGPSSVRRALGRAGLRQDAIVVTERNANRVSVFEPAQ